MNSPYVGTDEEQRRWLSTVAFDQPLDYTDPAGESCHSATGYYPGGYPRYISNPELHDLGQYDYFGDGVQSHSQSALAWSNSIPSFDSISSHVGSGYNTSSSSTWPLPHASFRSTVAFPPPEDYDPEYVPLQAYPVLPPHTGQPTERTNGSITTPNSDAPNPFGISDSDLAACNVEPASSLRMLEEQRMDPPLVPDADGTMPRQQSPRFVGDEYTASWICGSGVERVGWCGFCPTWHRLKDSAYWYHVRRLHFLRNVFTC